MVGSVYNHTITEKFEYFCINNFSFRRREIPVWHSGTSANSIVKSNFSINKTGWSCAIFTNFSKQFVMLPPLNFSTSYHCDVTAYNLIGPKAYFSMKFLDPKFL